MQSVMVGVRFVPLKAHLWNLTAQCGVLRAGTQWEDVGSLRVIIVFVGPISGPLSYCMISSSHVLPTMRSSTML